MNSMKRLLFTLLLGGLFLPTTISAQDGQNSLLYSSISQQLIGGNINGDANASILPSVATQNGYGSFFDNPASMALINMSYFNTGLLSNYAEQSNSYLGSSASFDNSNTQFGNIGLIYSVPADRGSFVVGGGYTLKNQINRTNALSATNTRSSITDVFKDESSDYHGIAFETYAIDYADVEQTILESIFRVGFVPGDFLGIQQSAEIKQRANIGEYSLFMASEVQKNLYIGASFGLIYGTYSYERNFLESDENNLFDTDFIDTESGGTDIDRILLTDSFDSEIVGANLNLGALYKIHKNVNIGVSYKIPTKLIISEDYTSSITTNLDNESTPFFDSFEGTFDYAIRQPGQLNLGFALEDIAGFTLSVSSETIDYRNTSIDLTRDSDLSFEDVVFLRDQEAVLDSTIFADYQLVTNLKAGLKYKSRTGFELRGGMGILPGKSSTFKADRTVISAGLGLPLSREVYLDLTAQYTSWNDRSILYEYSDPLTGQNQVESIDETISQINVMVGIKYRF